MASLALGACSLSQPFSEEDDAARGSLYRLTAEQISHYPSASSVEQLLEQHFSTVQFRTPDERPGATGQMYMLGAASPLFVIDGVPIDYNGSLGLSPIDVETIELVKHGESAFYGFRGSAGAILITTKSGPPAKRASSR
jgi:outer membrane cobalamin receptor